jgi:hypothetical protein
MKALLASLTCIDACFLPLSGGKAGFSQLYRPSLSSYK